MNIIAQREPMTWPAGWACPGLHLPWHLGEDGYRIQAPQGVLTCFSPPAGNTACCLLGNGEPVWAGRAPAHAHLAQGGVLVAPRHALLQMADGARVPGAVSAVSAAKASLRCLLHQGTRGQTEHSGHSVSTQKLGSVGMAFVSALGGAPSGSSPF